jgi:hypothetical protein
MGTGIKIAIKNRCQGDAPVNDPDPEFDLSCIPKIADLRHISVFWGRQAGPAQNAGRTASGIQGFGRTSRIA